VRLQAVVDWSDTLEAAVASGDEDRVVGALRIIRSQGPHEAQNIVRLLRDARSSRVRNAAAIALADMHPSNAAAVLIEVLSKPETKNSRGTLLYALEEVGAKAPLKLLTDIILSDTYEACQEALRFITSGNIKATQHELSQVLKELKASLSASDEEAASVSEAIYELQHHIAAKEKKRSQPLSLKQLATPLAGLSKVPSKTVETALKEFGPLIADHLKKGKMVHIAKLGVWTTRPVVAKTKKSIRSKAGKLRKRIVFRPSKDLRGSI
jgi:nucleoid DNA-binding protein